MKNALISPNESPIEYISGWTTDNPPEPIYTQIENSCRIAQISDETFEVSLPLFWVECDNNINPTENYYNTKDKQIYPIPMHPPYPK